MSGYRPSSSYIPSAPPSSPPRSVSPVSSPVRSAPPSSPLVPYLSSSTASSDEEQNSENVKKRRKKYEYYEPEVTFSPASWNPLVKHKDTGRNILEGSSVNQENVSPLSDNNLESDSIIDQDLVIKK